MSFKAIVGTATVLSLTILVSLKMQMNLEYFAYNRGKQRLKNLEKFGKPLLDSHLELAEDINKNSTIKSGLAINSRDDMGNFLEG